MTTIDDLRAELARERAAHAATRQVLEDAARDRGGVVVLSKAKADRVCSVLRSMGGCCELRRRGCHMRSCAVGATLRLVGGPEETQRQVDAAHAEALATAAEPLVGIDWARSGVNVVATLMPNFDEWVLSRASLEPGDFSPRDASTDASDGLDGAAPAPASLAEPEERDVLPGPPADLSTGRPRYE